MKIDYMCHMGDDLLVVNAARTSFSKESFKLTDKDAGLIAFLARERHLLPFRHPQVTLRCKAPLFVARQLGKHQVGMSWSEESRRYIKTDPEFYWPAKWRKAADNVKQGSSDEEIKDYSSLWQFDSIEQDIDSFLDESLTFYNHLLASGLAPELARMVLPQAVEISWVWTGSLLSWVHMVKERTHPTAQRETQEFARMVEEIVAPLYPVSWEALMKDRSEKESES